MSLIAKDLPTPIFLLLPGFISTGVSCTVTARPKTSEFERIVQSLVVTALVRLTLRWLKPVLLMASAWNSVGRWPEEVGFDWSVGIALVIGLAFAVFSNNDWFHSAFRKLRGGSRLSFSSEWCAAFAN